MARATVGVLAACAGLAGLGGLGVGGAMGQFRVPDAQVPAGNDPFTGQPWRAPGAYPRTVSGANFNVSIPAGSVLNGNNDNGDQALRVFPIRSGPARWTSGWTNEGDIDASLSPADPANALSYPPNANIRLRDTGGLRTYAWSINQYAGVTAMCVRANGRNNQDTVFGIPVGTLYGLTNVSADTFRSGPAYSMLDGTHRNGAGSAYLSMHYAGTAGNQEMSIDCGAAWFPYAQGWVGGYLRSFPGDNNDAVWVDGDGATAVTPGVPTSVASWQTSSLDRPQVTITLPGVNSATDGILLAGSYQDGNNPDYVVATPQGGGGWGLTYRRTTFDTINEVQFFDQCRFWFVYVPYSATNALAANIRGSDAATISGTGSYSVTRLATGRYRVSIPGKTDLDGTLILQSSGEEPGFPGLGRKAFFSYQPQGDGSFEVQARSLVFGNPGNAFGEDTELVDADFAFVWVDHTSPISLCPVDFNRDGFVDFFDYSDYVDCFETGNCPFARTADFNLDGFADFFDYADFVGAFQSGC